MRRQSKRGFSLLELMITLSIVIIVSAIAIPSVTYLLKNTQEQNLQSQLLRAIQLARTEAMMRHRMVLVSKLHAEWQDGFAVKIADAPLSLFENKHPSGRLSWRGALGQMDLVFLPTGYSQNGTFLFYREGSKKPVWAIVINHAGRVRVEFTK